MIMAEEPRKPEDAASGEPPKGAEPGSTPAGAGPGAAAGGQTPGGTGAAQEAGAGEAGAGEAGPQVVPVTALPTADLLVWLLNLLAAKAWEGMGLVPNPLTKKVKKDLGEARLAIDAYSALLETVRGGIEDAARRDLETLLTTLRLNFVEKSGPQ